MQITFLEIDTDAQWALASVGPAHIAAYIRERGHSAAMVRIAPEDSMPVILGRIATPAPDMIGISLTARQWPRAMHVARELQKESALPIIAGGVQASFAPKVVLASGGFDFVCLGEGEAATCELLDCLQRGEDIHSAQIANIWIKDGQRPKIRPPSPNLEQLPFLARDFLDEQYGVIHMATQRGCPFGCPYCVGGAIGSLYGRGRYHRQRTVAHVLEEIRHLCTTGRPSYIVFLDDTFTANRKRISEFCTRYGREVGAGFSITTRVESVDRQMLVQLAAAGCKHIAYGVESGNPHIRKTVLNRPLDDQRFIDVFRWTQEEGMMATANYMIGLPGETVADIEQTLTLNAALAPDDFVCFIFYPFPGTALFGQCRQKGYLPSNFWELPADTQQSVLELPDLSAGDIYRYHQRFEEIREDAFAARYGQG